MRLHSTRPSDSFLRLRERLEQAPARPDDLAAARREFDDWAAARPLPATVTAIPAPSPFVAPTEWLVPHSPRPGLRLLYVHGGGFRVGSVLTGRPIAAALAGLTDIPVLNLHYRLAPEYPFPAALSDVYRAYEALCASPHPARVAVIGDSAGANLVLSTMLWARAVGLPLPAAGYLISPAVDLSESADAISSESRDPMLDTGMLRQMRADYLQGTYKAEDPLVSPIWSNLTGLPPMLIQSGAAELLAPSIRVLASRLHAAGTTVHTEEWAHMFHVWPLYAGEFPEADAALTTAAEWLLSVLLASPAGPHDAAATARAETHGR